MNNIKYSELISIVGVCYLCETYKSSVECPECGGTFCVTCADGCESCGASIDFAS